MEEALPWIEMLREKAEAENVDIRRTAINVAQELRLYRQSGGIQKQIERANQELALANMATIQKQQALTVLIDLLNRGVKESQIVQLILQVNGISIGNLQQLMVMVISSNQTIIQSMVAIIRVVATVNAVTFQ
jgi:phosphatidylserine/phosphatidylglycerophosphate/cardiolipin synthase-like enzyme